MDFTKYYTPPRRIDPLQTLLDRNRKNKNNLMNVTGEPGNGKSAFAILKSILYGKLTGVEFDLKYVTFETDKFISLVKRGEKYRDVILDDAGMNYSSYDWHEDAVKVVGFVAQTMRYTGTNLTFTVPHSSLIAKTGRSICQFKVMAFDQGRLRWYRMKWNEFNGKLYHSKMCDIKSEMPPKDIWDEYERIKKEYVDGQFTDYEREVVGANYKKTVELASAQPDSYFIETIIENPDRYREVKKGRLWAPIIAHRLGISEARSRRLIYVLQADYPEIAAPKPIEGMETQPGKPSTTV